MKAFFFLFILITCSAKAEWFTQSSGTISNLNSVYFPVLNIGYIAGDNGTILKTIDGGASWVSKPAGTSNNLYAIYFLNANTGFTAGDNIILKTTDGGNTWTSQTISYSLKSVYFVNTTTGFAAGNTGAILKTVNSGNSWYVSIIEQSASFTSIYFSDVNIGHVVGLGGRYFKTTNGGISWISKVPPSTKNYYSVQFIDENSGYITGGWTASTIMKSGDNGESWNELLTGASGVRLYSGYFTDLNTGYAAGRNGVIMKTENGGVNWLNENSGTNEYLYSLNFVNSNAGYAVGTHGIILSTINVIGIQPISSQIPNHFSLSQNYPNPFNPNTKIRFDITGHSDAQTSLSIYDVLGKEVSILVKENLKPGTYEINFDASNYPSGVYYYRLQSGDYSETKKMVLIK